MTKFSKKVTDKIQKEHIKQIPHWRFVLKHTLFWVLFALALFIGAAAFSMILFAVLEVDFEIMRHGPHTPFSFFLKILPVFWILSFFLFLIIALLSLQHTKKGYRMKISLLIVSNLLGSMILGGSVYAFGGAETFEKIAHKVIPKYHHIDDRNIELWSHPEKGLLAGTIVDMTEDTIIILEDFEDKEWEVEIGSVDNIPERLRSELAKKEVEGKKIKVIGENTGDSTFEAEKIFPWRRHSPPFGPKPQPGQEYRPFFEDSEKRPWKKSRNGPPPQKPANKDDSEETKNMK